jgi:hypothetical protein
MRNTQDPTFDPSHNLNTPIRPLYNIYIYTYIYIHTYIYIYHLYRVDFHCQPGTNRGHIMTYPYLFQACWHPPFFNLRPKHTSKPCVASNGSQDNIFQGYPATTIGPFFGPTNLVSKSGWCHWHVWELTKKNEIKWMKLRILDEIGSRICQKG